MVIQPLSPSLMKITELAFTGTPVTDMKRAKAFYEGVLGLKKARGFGQSEGDEQWVEYDIGAGCLAIITGAADQWPPRAAGTAAALEVEDFEGAVAELKKANVKFIWDPRESPGCWMTVVTDPDGNWVVLHKRKAR